MANVSLLSSILQAPNGGTQSFLEGIFNPAVSYDELTKSILGPLSNDDTNAMRRTNSRMNSHLMALKPDGTFKFKQEFMRDKCDVRSLNEEWPHLAKTGVGYTVELCPNEINSSVRLRSCTREEGENVSAPLNWCHRDIDNFLVCTTCDQAIRNHPTIRNQRNAALWSLYWEVCAVCAESKEREYPNGARFCTCFEELDRTVLCFQCLYGKLRYLEHQTMEYTPRHNEIWRDSDGVVKFGLHPPREYSTCLGCGIRPCRSYPDVLYAKPVTRVCLVCRKYIIVPSQHPPLSPNHQPAADPTPTEMQAAYQAAARDSRPPPSLRRRLNQNRTRAPGQTQPPPPTSRPGRVNPTGTRAAAQAQPLTPTSRPGRVNPTGTRAAAQTQPLPPTSQPRRVNPTETRAAAQTQPETPTRRSGRLNPTATPATHIRLSYRGTDRSPVTEPQDPLNSSIPRSRRRKSPRGKH